MVAELCIQTYDRLTLPYNPDLDLGRELFIGNCPVCMLAPRTYREKVLPYDRFIRSQTRHLGLHHCGVIDRYLEDYRSLEPLAFIEVGWGSNVGAVRATFPTTTLDLMMNVYDAQGMSEERLREAVAEVVCLAAPARYVRDIWMADIGPEVPDEVIANFVEAVNAALPPANGRA